MSETNALEPLRRSTRHTLVFTVLTFGALPTLALTSHYPGPVHTTLLLGGVAVFLIAHGFRLSRAVRGPWVPFPLWQSWALLAYVMALSLYAFWLDVQTGIMCVLLAGLAATEFAIGRARRSAWLHIGIAAAIEGVVAGIAVALFAPDGSPLVMGLSVAGVMVFSSYCISIAFRQWERTLLLDKARQQAAELATTKERLRLAEDLHDILGHALEVVSLKSELAVRLGPVDQERSLAEMVEVQHLARTALQDVRALVQGNRPTDLGNELIGARKLLTSAGIECAFDANAELVSQRELLGRVLREAVTNLLRHANARKCGVSLVVTNDEATLRVWNDGAVEAAAGNGSGLTGLARRVGEAGGTFTAGPVAPEAFEVIATVPA